VVLAGTAVVAAVRLEHAARWRVAEEDRPLVQRTARDRAAAVEETTEQIRRASVPSVERRPGETCVGLITLRRDGAGSYIACYDKETGEVLSERERGPGWTNDRLHDRIKAWIVGL
jgi:hypothetical protein